MLKLAAILGACLGAAACMPTTTGSIGGSAPESLGLVNCGYDSSGHLYYGDGNVCPPRAYIRR